MSKTYFYVYKDCGRFVLRYAVQDIEELLYKKTSTRKDVRTPRTNVWTWVVPEKLRTPVAKSLNAEADINSLFYRCLDTNNSRSFTVP
jgi:hypothetical protein